MNLKKAKKLSSKVHRLISEMDHTEEFSAIEKALVKKYLVNLYEIMDNSMSELSEMTASNEKTEKKEAPVLVKKITKKPSKVEEIPTLQNEASIELQEDMEVDDIVEETNGVDIVEENKDATTQNEQNTAFLDDILSSFSERDLAAKLSLQPIKDIFKAMSINERIFTINELFDGQNDDFMDCIKSLNEANDINEAKNIIMDKALIPFEWEDSSKSKKVTKFIQLVYRKFN